LMWSYYELVTDRTRQEIAALRQEVASGKLHPMDAKMRLAEEVIAGFHGKDAARKAAENFQRVFRDREAPEEVPIFRVPAGPPRKIWDLLTAAGMVPSKSDGERIYEQGGVYELVGDQQPQRVERSIALIKGQSHLIKVGKKKFVRIVVE